MFDTSSAHALTGHIILFPTLSLDLWCVTMSTRTSLFYHLKVMETEVALKIWGEVWGISFLFLKNRMFLKQTVLVHHAPETSEYSQERMQKKKATTWSHAIVISWDGEDGKVAWTYILRYTQMGKAFCCFSPGSLFFIPLDCLDKMGCNPPSVSP